MPNRFWPVEDRTALVTGAARRIGRAIALALAEAGADVIVHYRESAEQARECARLIEDAGRRAWTVSADLSDPSDVEALFDRASSFSDRVDILVNSASIFPGSTVDSVSMDDFALNTQVNALAPFALMRRLAAQGGEGAIVNLLDTRIASHDPGHVAYLESKKMLHSLTRAAALEYAPSVRVNAVAPGLILPPPGEDESWLRRVAPTENPLQRTGSARQIADAVLFLVRSPFVTGQVVYVDGGRNVRERPRG